jgi:hypothetical protein
MGTLAVVHLASRHVLVGLAARVLDPAVVLVGLAGNAPEMAAQEAAVALGSGLRSMALAMAQIAPPLAPARATPPQ